MKKLIITEKPSVASDFIKILEADFQRNNGYFEGNTYIITWCVGHLINMSYPQAYDEKYKKWNLEDLPFLPEKYRYEIIKDVKEQFKIVKECLNRNDIDTIYYAGDAGREGEYIQRLVRQAAGRNQNAVEKRIWIDSQTEDEIKRGVKEAKLISEYDNLSDSGYMRAIEDYLIGINLSRGLSVKYGQTFNNMADTTNYTPISVGRVMTCVLGMIVNRERMIRNAVEIPFYGIDANISNLISAKWKSDSTSKYFQSPLLFKDDAFIKENDAIMFSNELNDRGNVTVEKIENTEEKKSAPLLYNLAELQAECSKKFKISPDETLQVAQSLYEKKMTTYPRTDARVLSSAVAAEINKNIKGLLDLFEVEKHVSSILDSQTFRNIINTRYTDDSKISDHYAIIPTGVNINKFDSLEEIEKEIYLLIVKRFLAIFMEQAVYKKRNITFVSNGEHFHCSMKKLINPGFLSLYNNTNEDEITDIENENDFEKTETLHENDVLNAIFTVAQGKTSTPKRYTSGSMVLAMENAGNLIENEELRAQIKGSGIGTSATRAETIKKLISNKYITLDSKTQVLKPSKTGEILYEIVKGTIPSLLNPEMTANWEKGLTSIVDGKVTKEEYQEKLNAYVTREINKIKEKNVMDSINEQINEVLVVYKAKPKSTSANNENNYICPICNSALRKFDWGYGCTGYQNGCKFSISKKQYGKELTSSQLEKLVTEGKTGKIKFHSNKSDKDYEAILVLDKESGKIEMKFPKS